jgi:hypothetical protein
VFPHRPESWVVLLIHIKLPAGKNRGTKAITGSP